MHQSALIDDRELLEAFARRNDHAAFAQLAERHARWIFAAALRQLRDRHLAQDAVQIVFILLARRACSMNVRQMRKLSGWLFNTPIPGDFAFKAGGTPDDYRRALVSILQDDLKKPVAITYRDVPRKVIVLHGKWNYHPARPDVTGITGTGPIIELYGTQFTPPNYAPMGFAGSAHDLGGFIGLWLNQSVIVEAQGLPSPLDWPGNSVEDLPNAPSKAHDPTLVLNHITEQTGLTWSEETRTVHRLFVESAK